MGETPVSKQVKHVPQAIHIGRGCDGAPIGSDLFGSHVTRSAKPDVALRKFERRMKAFGQTEIDDKWRSLGVNQDIGGLQVTVQNSRAGVRDESHEPPWR